MISNLDVLTRLVDEKIEPNLSWTKKSSHIDGYVEACAYLHLDSSLLGNFFTIFDPVSKLPIGGLQKMVPSLVSHTALLIANDKVKTNQFLKYSNVNCPTQRFFGVKDYEIAYEHFKSVGTRSVVKPSNGAGGKGVTIDVSGQGQFKKAWDDAVSVSNNLTRIIVEDFCEGVDIRVIIVDHEFICAVTRVPAYIQGDGSSSITSLIEKKNMQRKLHPHHRRFLLPSFSTVESQFSRVGYTSAEQIVKDGEVVWLADAANIHQGGEAVDVTDWLGEEVIDLAISAVRAVPGLNTAGVDILTSSFDGQEKAVVIEMNVAANFGIHYYPFYGVPRNPAAAVIKAMAKQTGSHLDFLDDI